MQVFKRFPLLHPLQYLAAPVAKLKALSAVEAAVRDSVLGRIARRGNTEHIDLFDYVLPADCPVPSDKHELTHVGALAQQMVFANYGPMADWYYGTILFLLKEPEYFQYLSKEIRDKFESYHDITPSSLTSLRFLHACLEESLRLLPGNNTGLPRISPGAVIDGYYIPKKVSVPSSAVHPSYFGSVASDGVLISDRPTYKPASSRRRGARASTTIHCTIGRSAGSPRTMCCTIRCMRRMTSRPFIPSVLARGLALDENWRGCRESCSWPKSCGRLMWSKYRDRILIWR